MQPPVSGRFMVSLPVDFGDRHIAAAGYGHSTRHAGDTARPVRTPPGILIPVRIAGERDLSRDYRYTIVPDFVRGRAGPGTGTPTHHHPVSHQTPPTLHR